MFFLPIVTLGFATAALASPMKRLENLTVKVTAASAKVNTIDEIALTAVVKNNGAEDVRVLKYNTILDSLPTRSFTVTKNGAPVAFTGIKLQVDLEQDGESAYVTIPAGKEVSVTHKVSSIYDFASAGVGSFTFEPIATFSSPEADSKALKFASATPSANSVAVEVTSDVKGTVDHEKRGTVSCSNASQSSFISASYSEAKTLANVAASWISSNSGTSLYTAYWGTNSATTVRSRFTAVAGESGSRTYSCTDPYGACSGGVIAYTLIATTNIYFCSIFFNEKANSALCSGTTVASRNIRGGTTLHEMTHALSGTDDVTYGCAADQALSVANKLKNADNYNCFSTQVYQNTQC